LVGRVVVRPRLPDEGAVAVEEGGAGGVHGVGAGTAVRRVTARTWASSPSARASVVTAGARASRPARSRAWKVTVRRKRSTVSPLVLRAKPAVGSVWLVPDA